MPVFFKFRDLHGDEPCRQVPAIALFHDGHAKAAVAVDRMHVFSVPGFFKVVHDILQAGRRRSGC